MVKIILIRNSLIQRFAWALEMLTGISKKNNNQKTTKFQRQATNLRNRHAFFLHDQTDFLWFVCLNKLHR